MRARLIKPGFFRDVKLLALPVLTRHLFAGLWCLADRAGRLVDDPLQIKIDILPIDDGDVNAMLDALDGAGLVQRYAVAGRAYIQVVNFSKHQSPHGREPASTIPAPVQNGASTRPAPVQHPSSPAVIDPVAVAVPEGNPPPVLSEPAEGATAPPTPRPDLLKPKDREKGRLEQHPLFPVIDELFGPLTRSQWSSLTGHLRDLDTLSATPDDLRARHARYPTAMGKDRHGTPMVLTLRSLIEHWKTCAPPTVNGQARAPTVPPLTVEEGRALRERLLSGKKDAQ